MKLLIDFPEIDLKFMRETYKGTGCSFIPSAIQNECVEAVYNGAQYEERKTGKWIPATPLPMEADSYKHKRYWKCSVCGGHDFFNPQYSEKIKFCRYCGAELEVEDAEY